MFTNPVVRKVLGTVLAVIIAVVGVVGIIAFFDARDSSTTGAGTATTKPKEVNGGSVLREGNIVLTYSDPSFRAPLRDFSEQNGGDNANLRAAGGAVIVKRDPAAAGVVARAYGETFNAKSPDDPGLQDFVDNYLGQGASG